MAAAWWRRRPPDDPAAILAREPGLIDRVIASLLAVHRLTGRDAEQLASFVRRRIAENDFAIVREHKGESSLLAFLMVIAERLAIEHRDALWARWRDEAAAAGNAEIAATLERLVYEQALPIDEALQAAGVVDDPPRRSELEALWARRPWGGVRPILDLKWQDLSRRAGGLLEREPTALERHLSAILSQLAVEEHLMLYQRFAGGLPIEAIASWLRRPSDEVSRQIDGLLDRLGGELAEAGVEATDVAGLLADPRPGHARRSGA